MENKSMTVPLKVVTAAEREIQEKERVPPRTIKMLAEYDGVAEIAIGGVENTSWNDNMLCGLEGIKLGHMTRESLSILGDFALRTLQEGVSEVSAGTFYLLAWNLFSTGSRSLKVFPRVDTTSIGRKVSVEELSDVVMNPTGEKASWSKLDQSQSTLTAICYIAASLLRLLTKEATSYVRAIPHLMVNYHRLYKRPFPIQNFSVNSMCIESLRNIYQSEGILRNTISGFLYHYGESPEDVGLCRMLYEQHLGYTGMHAFPLFAQASVKTHLTSQELLSALDCRMTRRALKTLVLLINTYEVNSDETRVRKTYKYARLFDASAFSSLQTKNCPELVCILANLCLHAGTQGAGNILDIAVIKQLSESAKSMFSQVARKIFEAAIYSDSTSGGNPMFEMDT